MIQFTLVKKFSKNLVAHLVSVPLCSVVILNKVTRKRLRIFSVSEGVRGGVAHFDGVNERVA